MALNPDPLPDGRPLAATTVELGASSPAADPLAWLAVATEVAWARSTARRLPGKKINPIASTPAATATAASSARVIPHTLIRVRTRVFYRLPDRLDYPQYLHAAGAGGI